MKKSSLLLLSQAESDVSVALSRLTISANRRRDFNANELAMLDTAIVVLKTARKKLRSIQPLAPKGEPE